MPLPFVSSAQSVFEWSHRLKLFDIRRAYNDDEDRTYVNDRNRDLAPSLDERGWSVSLSFSILFRRSIYLQHGNTASTLLNTNVKVFRRHQEYHIFHLPFRQAPVSVSRCRNPAILFGNVALRAQASHRSPSEASSTKSWTASSGTTPRRRTPWTKHMEEIYGHNMTKQHKTQEISF